MRGCEKRVIHLKKTNSHLFDEAYFIVKREAELSSFGESDMVLEANRIIKESLGQDESRIRSGRQEKIKNFLPPFLLGALFSSLVLILTYIILLF